MTNTLNKIIHNGDEYEFPTGWWDVLVSDQPNNILTSWMKIWAGTEWDYANLSSYDNNTVYLTVEWWATQSSDQWQWNDSEGNR